MRVDGLMQGEGDCAVAEHHNLGRHAVGEEKWMLWIGLCAKIPHILQHFVLNILCVLIYINMSSCGYNI